jgi:type IV fimbrial biogenesis protein FimT
MRTSFANTLRSTKGFTLIELMVAISVLGILLALALPDMRSFLVNSRLSSDINGFVGLINYARSEAIVRNQDVVVCPKSNTSNACIATLLWGEYQIQAFVDIDGNGTRNGADILLKTISATDPAGTQRAINLNSTNVISFSAAGFSQRAMSFNIFARGDAAFELRYGRTLCVSKPGRVRVIASGTC